MARSKRRTAIAGITSAESEKEDKQISSRLVRHANTQILRATGDDAQLKDRRELYDSWALAKDGKMPFDSKANPKRLRK